MDDHTGTGIIPTRMGTSVIQQAVNDYRKDHPHTYGDKIWRASDITKTSGSSPRVWGQDMISDMGQWYDRIIPTRMGTR